MPSARPLIAAVALAAALVLPAAAPAATVSEDGRHRLTLGIADQKLDFFGDPEFREAGFRHVRINVGWDWSRVPLERAKLEAWLAEAHARGLEPLVSFGHSRRDRRDLPTPAEYSAEFERFRERWPAVTEFAVWNEANHCGEPTCNRPELVAAYYRRLRRKCDDCKLLAAELLDMPNMVEWMRDFRRQLGFDAKYWGLHNYVDTNRFRTQGTRRMLRELSPRSRVWLTETGGIVARRNRSDTQLCEGPRHAGEATRWLFDKLVPISTRIQRVYVYHWNSSTARDSWDSALFNHRGEPRPAWWVLRRVVRDGLRPDLARNPRVCERQTGEETGRRSSRRR